MQNRWMPLLAGAMLLASATLHAASLTLSFAGPTPGANDIYNFSGTARDRANVSDGAAYADGGANDAFTYVASDRASQGQTFTTGSATNVYTLNAIWLRHAGYTNNTALTYWRMGSGATLTVRVTDPALAGTAGFALATETYTTTGWEGWPTSAANSTDGSGNWLKFTLTSPVTLQSNKTYGFDVTSASAVAFWEWLGTSNAVYAGGSAYNGSTSGVPDNTLNPRVGDRVFLVELAFGTGGSSGGTNSPVALIATPFALTNVTLLPSQFQTNMLRDAAYLLSLDADRLLYTFRANVGLSTSNALPYGGWETPGSTLCLGHFLGHYLTACSQMYASTRDAQFKARTDFLVGELAKCQAASPAAGFNTGYLSAFPEYYINDVINQTQSSYFSVPWYTLHKVMAGLLDVRQYTGNTQALTVLTNMANWVQFRMDQLTDAQVQGMLNYREYGGMNEVLANLCGVTGNTNYLRIAADFDKLSLFFPLALHRDVLDGLHANTQIPEITGVAREYELTGAAHYQETAGFFWDRVANYRSYAIGGNSEAEYFFPIAEFPSRLTARTAETCNTYNMLKLTRHLFQWSPSAAAMDFYERALYNQILASQEPLQGMTTYFVSLKPGHFKTYSTPANSFWCCTGTGVENHSKYGDTIYFRGSNSLYLNLFIPSILNWPERRLTVVQNTAFPESDTTTLIFQCTNGTPLTLNVRYPSWAQSGMSLSINGTPQAITNSPGSYVSIARNWQTNDQVQIRFPMTLRTESLPGAPNTVAMFYGPVLLAGALGTNGMPASDLAAGQLDFEGVAVPAGIVPSIIGDIPTLLSNTVPAAGGPLAFQIQGPGRPQDVTLLPFYQVHHQRYSVYWSLIAPSAVSVWSGGGSPANWSVATNWNLLPTNQCAVQFGLASGGTTTNNLTAGTQINGIQFQAGAGGFVLNGNSIVLAGDVVNDSANGQRINLPIQLSGGIPWIFDAAAGDLTLGNAISGSGSLDKQGVRRLTALSNFTFSGAARVGGGELQIGNGGSSGDLAGRTVTVDAGAALAFNRGDTFQVTSTLSGAGSVIKRGAGAMEFGGSLSNSGPTIVEAGTLRITSQSVPVLQHRWSFNGNLTDSFGTNNAVVVDVGANNTTLTASNITLSGGTQAATDYVSFGSGLLPKDGSPATIELWATQLGVQNWSRVFDVGASSTENFVMSWTQGATLGSDRVEWRDSTTTRMDNSCAPYTLGTEYHVAMVIEPIAAGTRVTWYAAPSGNGSLGAARGSFETVDTLAAMTDSNFWLGRSEYSADSTANAAYNEVRLWKRAFGQSELQQLHALGPNAIGSFATNSITGALGAQSDMVLQPGAALELGGSAQRIASLSGGGGCTVSLGGGKLVIGSGGDPAATFGGAFSGAGSIQVDGKLRLVGGATLSAGISMTNNGTLDIMTWNGALPSGFVNHGTVLDRSLIKVDSVSVTNGNAIIKIHGYPGHGYQLQYRDDLGSGSWQSYGQAISGDDAPISLAHPGGAAGARRYYRVLVSP